MRTLDGTPTSTARTEQDIPGRLDNTCRSIQRLVSDNVGGCKEPHVCPFSFWNSTDTLHQTHSPSVAVLEMTDKGRAEDMDPSSILGGLRCSEKSGVFGTSFAIRRFLGAYNTSSVLGHQHG